MNLHPAGTLLGIIVSYAVIFIAVLSLGWKTDSQKTPIGACVCGTDTVFFGRWQIDTKKKWKKNHTYKSYNTKYHPKRDRYLAARGAVGVHRIQAFFLFPVCIHFDLVHFVCSGINSWKSWFVEKWCFEPCTRSAGEDAFFYLPVCLLFRL